MTQIPSFIPDYSKKAILELNEIEHTCSELISWNGVSEYDSSIWFLSSPKYQYTKNEIKSAIQDTPITKNILMTTRTRCLFFLETTGSVLHSAQTPQSIFLKNRMKNTIFPTCWMIIHTP